MLRVLSLSGYPYAMGVVVERLPVDPLEALRELTRTEEELGVLRRRSVEAARAAGASWDQIGEALGMTRQSAWEYFTRPMRAAMAERVGASDLDEEEALTLAVEETRAVRRRRAR